MFFVQVIFPGILLIVVGSFIFKLFLDELDAFIDDMKGSD